MVGGVDDAVLNPFQRQAQRAVGVDDGGFGGGAGDAAFFQLIEDDLGVQGREANELTARADGGEEKAFLIGQKNDECSAGGFFEGFEKRVLGLGVHQFGLLDDEDFAAAEDGMVARRGD